MALGGRGGVVSINRPSNMYKTFPPIVKIFKDPAFKAAQKHFLLFKGPESVKNIVKIGSHVCRGLLPLVGGAPAPPPPPPARG